MAKLHHQKLTRWHRDSTVHDTTTQGAVPASWRMVRGHLNLALPREPAFISTPTRFSYEQAFNSLTAWVIVAGLCWMLPLMRSVPTEWLFTLRAVIKLITEASCQLTRLIKLDLVKRYQSLTHPVTAHTPHTAAPFGYPLPSAWSTLDPYSLHASRRVTSKMCIFLPVRSTQRFKGCLFSLLQGSSSSPAWAPASVLLPHGPN